MQIVDATRPKSKAQTFRDAVQSLADNPDSAVKIDLLQDVHQFGKVARTMGYKVSWRKQSSGGWLVWVVGQSLPTMPIFGQTLTPNTTK